MIVFQRDAENRVTGFIIDSDAVRDLVFKRSDPGHNTRFRIPGFTPGETCPFENPETSILSQFRPTSGFRGRR